jgi:hypothetical protein
LKLCKFFQPFLCGGEFVDVSGFPLSVERVAPRPLIVRQVVMRMPGGSQSILVRCEDGLLYVMKLNGNPQGQNVLANEFLGAYLLHGLQVRTPRVAIVAASPKETGGWHGFSFQHTHCCSKPKAGLHFASAFLARAGCGIAGWTADLSLDHVEESSEFLSLALFDLWANHRDKRQFIGVGNDGIYLHQTFAIDHGHLFGGPAWDMTSAVRVPRWWGRQFSRATGDTISALITNFQQTVPTLLREGISQIPDDWYKGDIGELEDRLLHRLDSLRSICENSGSM